MESLALGYSLVSTGFVVLLNLLAAVCLGLNYRNTRKPYLAIAIAAAIVESLRQIPDLYIGLVPELYLLYFPSLSLQFSATLLLLSAVMYRGNRIGKLQWPTLACLGALFLTAMIFMAMSAPPPQMTVIDRFLVFAPVILTSATVVWCAVRSKQIELPSQLLLLSTSCVLFAIRACVPFLDEGDMFYLVYYMEVLSFPVVLIALAMAEAEIATQNVQKLLAERTQSEQDLQFILDHSVDVILVVDEAGLILSWSKRAEETFCYAAGQVVGKYHVDDLFSDNYWHQNSVELREFDASMENIEGKSFNVFVRMKTVIDGQRIYSIYVVSDKNLLNELQPEIRAPVI